MRDVNSEDFKREMAAPEREFNEAMVDKETLWNRRQAEINESYNLQQAQLNKAYREQEARFNKAYREQEVQLIIVDRGRPSLIGWIIRKTRSQAAKMRLIPLIPLVLMAAVATIFTVIGFQEAGLRGLGIGAFLWLLVACFYYSY